MEVKPVKNKCDKCHIVEKSFVVSYGKKYYDC